MHIVGLVLVKNEDRFIEAAIRNAAPACDSLIVLDNGSTDQTVPILTELARRLPHMQLHHVSDAMDTQRFVEPFVGERAWVLGVDGDELYDTAGLLAFRKRLKNGEFNDFWAIYGHALHCLKIGGTEARGFMTPASRSMTKLFNMRHLASWSGTTERLHAEPNFKGERPPSLRLCDNEPWDSAQFRALHACFMQRSSLSIDRLTGVYNDDGVKIPAWLRLNPSEIAANRPDSRYKNSRYNKGPVVTVDSRPFVTNLYARTVA